MTQAGTIRERPHVWRLLEMVAGYLLLGYGIVHLTILAGWISSVGDVWNALYQLWDMANGLLAAVAFLVIGMAILRGSPHRRSLILIVAISGSLSLIQYFYYPYALPSVNLFDFQSAQITFMSDCVLFAVSAVFGLFAHFPTRQEQTLITMRQPARMGVISWLIGVFLIAVAITLLEQIPSIEPILQIGYIERVSDALGLAIYIRDYFGYPVALIFAAFGLAMRRVWGRQLAFVICLLALIKDHFWVDATFAAHPSFTLEAVYAIGLIYALIPPRRLAFPAARSFESPPSFRSAIAYNENWRSALSSSLRGPGIQPAPIQDWELALLAFVAGMIVIVGSGFAAQIARDYLSHLGHSRDESLTLARVLGIVLPVVAARAGVILMRQSRQMRARSAQEELRRDGSRRPVLYLRSFALDEEVARPTTRELLIGGSPTVNAEVALAKVFNRCGPVIAIGRPGEKLPGLGAARFYVDNEHWHEKVADVAAVAELIVLTSGTSDGLRWEVAHLLENVLPAHLIVWAHPYIMRAGAKTRESEWKAFLQSLGRVFPHPFPEHLGHSRFFHFASDWKPIPVSAPRPLSYWPLRLIISEQTQALKSLLTQKEIPPFDVASRKRRRRRNWFIAAVTACLMIAAIYGYVYIAHQ